MDVTAKLTEILSYWDDGLLNWLSLFGMLDELLLPDTIDQVIARLSPKVRDRYVLHLRETYGNPDLKAEDFFVLFGGMVDREHAVESQARMDREYREAIEVILPTVQAWLARTNGGAVS